MAKSKKKAVGAKKKAARVGVAPVLSFERGKDYRVTFRDGYASTYSGDALCQTVPFDPANVVRVVAMEVAKQGMSKPEEVEFIRGQ